MCEAHSALREEAELQLAGTPELLQKAKVLACPGKPRDIQTVQRLKSVISSSPQNPSSLLHFELYLFKILTFIKVRKHA